MSKRRVFLNLWSAYDAGDKRHAQVIMDELATTHGFRIIEAIPQSIAWTRTWWEFVIEAEGDVPWPVFVREMPPPPEVDMPAILQAMGDLPDTPSVRFVLNEPPVDPVTWLNEHVFHDQGLEATHGPNGVPRVRERPEP